MPTCGLDHRVLPAFGCANELIAARARAGLTQEAVAQRMGTTKSAVSRLKSVGVGANTPFMLYGFTGGALEFGVYASFEADVTSQPWTFTASLNPSIGWDFDVPVAEVSSDGYLLKGTSTFPIAEMAGDRTC